MQVRLPESLSCEVTAYRYFEAGLTSFMLERIRPGMIVYDVGAHYGYFTLLGARLVGATGKVHSFEPTPSTFRVLARNVASVTNVTATNAAVWHEAAELHMRDFGHVLSMYNSLFEPRLPDYADADKFIGHVVEAVSLDEYSSARGAQPDFVKIDAESAELNVLQGMERLLKAHKPLVTLEVGDFDVRGASTSRVLLKHVMDYGYEAFDFADGAISRHDLRERYTYDNILLVPAP